MITSNNGIEFIKWEEGCVLHVYKDQIGKDTIGVGHLITAGERWPEKITEEQANALLKTDLRRFEDALNETVSTKLEQHEFDAVISLMFNIGTGNFAKSSVKRFLSIGNKPEAAKWFLAWTKARKDGKLITLPVLVNRRKREQKLFLSGEYA